MDVMDFYHLNDRRMHRRFAVALSARVYHANGRFSLCATTDLSLAGAAIHLTGSETQPVTGFGCDETGKLAVTCFQVGQPRMRLMFDTTVETRAVIKRALHALGDRQMIQPLSSRRGERLVTRHVVLTRADGTALSCDILDMAPQGMLLGSDARPPLGERVSLGKIAGVVARHHAAGFAIRTGTLSSNVVHFPVPYRRPPATPAPRFDGTV
jgi:hypothetical protein